MFPILAPRSAGTARQLQRGATGIAAALLLLLSLATGSAHAMKIQSVKSPGGIEAWLVQEHSIPLIAMRFAFDGGSSQEPEGREGLAGFLSSMLDEGAGPLNATQYQERMEELAMRMSFEGSKDAFYGSFETLTVNRDAAVELLRLAMTEPRLEADAVERVRRQLLARVAHEAKNPSSVASREWTALAFSGHPYGRNARGTEETLKAITRDDLEAFRKKNFARSTLRVVVVGDIDAKALGALLDKAFGGLAAKADLRPITVLPQITAAKQTVHEIDVPQSVVIFGLNAMPRKDPDYMAAFVMNQILGGGGFASRLTEEVREKRGLAYSVYSYLQSYKHASIFAGGVATKNESVAQSIQVIRDELKRMATDGPSPTELENAKSYLTGSYALRFDTNSKIASQLLGIWMEDLGIDYVDKRNKLVDVVTMDDVKRVARRLLKTDELLITVVGKPKNL